MEIVESTYLFGQEIGDLAQEFDSDIQVKPAGQVKDSSYSD